MSPAILSRGIDDSPGNSSHLGQKIDEIKAQAARGRDEAATGWQAMKDERQSHVADLHAEAASKKDWIAPAAPLPWMRMAVRT
jgi:hypothetical protein